MKLGAASFKRSIRETIKTEALLPHSTEPSPFHNPIAQKIKEGKIGFSGPHQATLQDCRNSAKLIITAENCQILLNYFEERKTINDKLGNLYKTLSFTDFILRLAHKRFKEVYYDGRAVVLRDGRDFGGFRGGKGFLRQLGTQQDKKNLFEEYLTMEESTLSPLVIPQATSVVIGTGSRSHESNWDVKRELNESIDIATFSYPAAAEFRGGHTAHYDLLFILKPQSPDADYLYNVDLIRKNPALMNAAKRIYGAPLVFDIDTIDEHHFEMIRSNEGKVYYLHKSTYLARTKNTLKSVLLAADMQMKADNLGRTFQLKGLGLGAFSFSGNENTEKLQALYIQSLLELLSEESFALTHIQCINLINLPTDLARKPGGPFILAEQAIKNIRLIQTVMDPTSSLHQASIGEIGGVVVCGDSGSKFGNEGNIGLGRSSSDDPAAQYSLIDPLILDPDANPVLKHKNCIQVIRQGALSPCPERESTFVRIRRPLPQQPEVSKKFAIGIGLSVGFALFPFYGFITMALCSTLGIVISPFAFRLVVGGLCLSTSGLIALSLRANNRPAQFESVLMERSLKAPGTEPPTQDQTRAPSRRILPQFESQSQASSKKTAQSAEPNNSEANPKKTSPSLSRIS